MKSLIALPVVALFVFSMHLDANAAPSDEPKPAADMSLLEIITKLEDGGYGPFTDVEFDDGEWEIEVYKGDIAYELLIDRTTGEIIAEHRDHGGLKPPADAKKLSEIIKGLEAEGYSRIRDISFEWRNWEVEAIRERTKRELKVNPVTGKVVSDRVDD